ncbi:MAG: hypothetical protein IID33_14085, partial [Planctomycetes bacterium]|nr:hypothetical protein [Planctomycetota bacterium]
MRNVIRILAVALCVGVTGAAGAQLKTSTGPMFHGNDVAPPSNWLFGSQVLTNGDFEMPSILGAGQTEVGAFDDMKLIEVDPNSSFWPSAISGVRSWDNALQFGGPPPSRSDQGIATWEDIAGTPPNPRFAFINNWDRRFNQTVSTLIVDGVTYTATIEFATRIDPPDQKRAGLFELRAGPMNPDNPDDPGTSILLDAVTAGQSGFYGGADPDVVVNDREFTLLT